MDMSIHKIKKLEIGKVERLNDHTYVRTIWIRNKHGEYASITMFADDHNTLEVIEWEQ